jgi:hypothetical protein
MLTQKHSDISNAIRLERSHMGIRVFLGEDDSQLMGVIETDFPVWGLDNYKLALDLGLEMKDECYVANHQPYIKLAAAVGAVTAAYLTAPDRLQLPDYF